MSLSTSLVSQVSALIRERGREYYRNGQVEVLSTTATEVAANVYGTEDYEVDLATEGRTVYASCSCPYVADNNLVCKHIWATVLALDSTPFAAHIKSPRIVIDDGEEFGDEPGGFFFAPPPAAGPPKPKADDWRKQLARLSEDVRPRAPFDERRTRPSERQLLFVVDTSASETAKELVLEINFQERKKNNEWGKPKAQHLSRDVIEALPDAGDRQVLALLGGAERGDRYSYGFSGAHSGYYGYSAPRYKVAGPLLDAVLPLLAASGRVRLRVGTDPHAPFSDLAPDLDVPWQLTVGVTADAGGQRWELSGALKRGDETLGLRAPDLIVPGLVVHGGRFARLADSASFPWVPVLRRAGTIAVPKANADEFIEQLLQLPGLPKLELPEALHVTEEAVPPRPRVTVKSAKPNALGAPPVLEAKLSFDYAGAIVEAGAPGRGSFLAEGKRFLVRDPDAERAAAARLHRAGARQTWIRGKDSLEVKPTALPKLVRDLAGEGWQVEAEGKLYRQAREFQINVSSGSDWFDLKATADFGGTTVALPRLLAAVKKGETSIALDDGSVGMVPEEWLKKYGLLAGLGTVEGDTVRFGKSQVGVLDAMLASRPEVTFDAQFAKARDELNRFSGVAPADPPPGFRGTLREYQREGLGWLRFLRDFGFGGCLADDMGLGKTIQVLSLLAGPRNGPALVVVPKSLVFNWKSEAAKFAPELKVLEHTGLGRDKTGAGFKDHDIVLTTYGTLRNDAATFAGFHFDTCVLDESQAAKNASTETAKAVRLVRADHRLAMSGTPVENHLGELFALFDFLNPGMLGRGALAGIGRTPDPETREVLGKALRPFILRRTKTEVAKDLPAKTEQTVYCDLEGEQQKLYAELRDHYRTALLSRVDTVGMGKSKIMVLEALLRLRQAACHPGLIDKGRADEASAKLDVLLPQIAEVTEEGHKALVFSQFTGLLSIVRKRLDAEKIPYEYLDGKTRDRAARVQKFQTDPNCKLFLISLKAGGVGLNLTAAEYVFLLDPWWNPAVEAQAIDRSHRIGQTNPVFAYRLIARGTVEEKVLALQESKRALADAILGGDGSLITDLKREDLEMLLS